MDWKKFWSQPAIIIMQGTPEEIKEFQKSKQLEKKGFVELMEK